MKISKEKEKEESKEITESPKSPNIEFNAEEEYKNLPDFIKSMIGNIYYSSSRKSSNSDHFKVSNINHNANNNITISNFNSINNITDFSNNNIINFNKIEEEKLDEGKIKIFNIKDSNLSIMKKSFRLNNILQDDLVNYRNNIKECSICFRNIINYGLLSNCDDIFCYECIRQWRNEAKQKSKRERFRRCPLCNKESPLLIKSKTYLTGEEKKQKMLEFRNENNNNNNN
jgi:hypothetical protein